MPLLAHNLKVASRLKNTNHTTMKKNLFLFLGFILLGLNGIAQDKANLIIFSEDGDKFFAFVNGIRQNDKPESNVKVTGLSPNINVRIEFEDKALPQIKQNMFLEGGLEHTAKIKRDMKKQIKMRYFGQTPITTAATPGMSTVEYHTTENPVETQNNSGNVNINTNVNPTNGNTSITTTTTTTTTKTTTGGNGSENVSVNINMGGVGLNMNVNGMGMGMDNTNMNTTTSTTVTSSSTTSGSYASSNTTPVKTKTDPAPAATPAKAGCTMAMSQVNFDKMKQSIADKPFSDTKMSTAKVATKNACLSVDQVKAICNLFSMDEDKLTYAKYAYNSCVDKANYYQVSDVFSFSGTTEEFNKFLEQ